MSENIFHELDVDVAPYVQYQTNTCHRIQDIVRLPRFTKKMNLSTTVVSVLLILVLCILQNSVDVLSFTVSSTSRQQQNTAVLVAATSADVIGSRLELSIKTRLFVGGDGSEGAESADTSQAQQQKEPVNCPNCDRCDGSGRIIGGIGVVAPWWPIKAYRPCPNFVESGGVYERSGQGLDEIAFGRDSTFDK